MSDVAKDMFREYEERDWKTNNTGLRAGSEFKNDGRDQNGQLCEVLPSIDKRTRNFIGYTEYYINKTELGADNVERFVRGDNGKIYYTNNHYRQFNILRWKEIR